MNVFQMCADCHPSTQMFLIADFMLSLLPVLFVVPNIHYIKQQCDYEQHEILNTTASLLQKGEIVAIKGMGGFFIACDAGNNLTVERLRVLKSREAKPFAVMFRDLATVKKYAFVEEAEEKALVSLRRPIVLLNTRTRLLLPYVPALTPSGRCFPICLFTIFSLKK